MVDAELIVRDLISEVAAERGLPNTPDVRAVSSGGANYTSALFTVTLSELKLFSKVASISENMRGMMNAERLYMTEQVLYKDLLKTYTDILKKRSATEFRIPKIYAMLQELGKETIVMEDLSDEGYRAPSRHDTIDWRFASAAVIKMAAFHALSFAFERDFPVEFSAKSELFKYVSPVRTPETASIDTWSQIIKGAVQMLKEKFKARVEKVLTGSEGYIAFRSPIYRTVLIHGDYRTSNLMMKEKDGELDVIVVDYQMVHPGSPAADLLYFIFLGTDQSFRDQYYEKLLQHYHESLGASLVELGLNVDQEYPRDIFYKEIKEMQPNALLVAAAVLPLITVEEGSAPDTSGDANMQSVILAPNQVFAQRFQALVEDCAKWGVL